MRFSPFKILATAMWAAAAFGPLNSISAAPARPNVVLILADDYGWKDCSTYGSELYETPNIDRLAREGMKFTQAYSACTVCSPTRAAILTGKYPARLHITDWIPGLPPDNPKLLVPDWTKYLPLEEKTLAEVFKAAGYATASIGKWHLGGQDYYPEKQGFDVNIAGTHAPAVSTYFSPYNIATLTNGADGEYVTDRLADEAVKWIEAQQHKPFFLYLPHFAVHTPVQGKKSIAKKYRDKLKPGVTQTNAMYAAMVESLDDAVGRVRASLDQLNLSSRTIIVFTSDNGGRVPTTSNLPLRVGKGSCYEGGTRIPLIIYWPGMGAGGTNDTPVISMDLFPTLLEAAKVKESSSGDGVSLIPILRGTGQLERDELFWHYPHYQHYQLGGTTPYGAIRKGDFKLIEFFDDLRVELYDLSKDPGEQRNLAKDMPAKVDELRKRLHAWRKEVGAQMPTPNPKYDPAKPEFDRSTQQKKKEAG
jgi:arylsulfatase A